MTAARKTVLDVNLEANVHAVRAVLYETLATLLDPACVDPDLKSARAALGALHFPPRLERAHVELSTALKGVDQREFKAAQQRSAGEAAAMKSFCQRGYGQAWPRACVAAELQAPLTRLAELGVMARLARRTAQAEREGDTETAVELRSLQRNLLSEHSGLCLETLGAQLAAQGDAIFSGLGRGLNRLIEADVLGV